MRSRFAVPLRSACVQSVRHVFTHHALAALFASASLAYSRGETACSTVVRTKSVAQPHQTSALERDHVEAARGHRATPCREEMLRGVHEPLADIDVVTEGITHSLRELVRMAA